MDEITLLFYLGFVAGTAYYAHSRGRNPVIWGGVAFLISPLLAFILLACMKDLQLKKEIVNLDRRTEQLGTEMRYQQQFNDYRSQHMQQQIGEVQKRSELALQQSRGPVIKTLAQAGLRSCPQCQFAVRADQVLCPNCGESVAEMPVQQFELALICPLKAHISHIQELLLTSDRDQRIKSLEYLDVVTGQGLPAQHKKLIFVVHYFAAAEVSTQSVHQQLARRAEQAGYEVMALKA